MANLKSNYKKGYRYDIMKICMTCGAVPFKSLPLLYPNKSLATTQHAIARLVVEGEDFEKYHDQKYWVITLSNNGRKKIRNQEKEIMETFPPEIIEMTQKSKVAAEKLKLKSKKYQGVALREYRNIETFIFFLACNMKVYPGEKEEIIFGRDDAAVIQNIGNIANTFYTSKEMKIIEDLPPEITEKTDEKQKLMTTIISACKLHGMVIMGNRTYGVMNAGDGMPHFSLSGETKGKIYIQRMINNAKLSPYKGLVMLYNKDSLISKVLLASLKTGRVAKSVQYFNNLNAAYEQNNIYVIPNNEYGKKMIAIMKIAEWEEVLLSNTFPDDQRKSTRSTTVECHACSGKMEDSDISSDFRNYFFAFIVPDISKLKRFIEKAVFDTYATSLYHILCFDFQVPLFTELANEYPQIKLHQMSIDQFVKYDTRKEV